MGECFEYRGPDGTRWEYEPLDDERCAITRIVPVGESVVVPEAIEGLRVVRIQAEACMDQPGVRAVTLPYGLQEIGRKAFAYDEGLTGIRFPDSLTRIGDFAFMHTGLQRVELPPAMEELGEKAFYCCAYLQQATLNSGLRSIGAYAFEQTALTTLEVPSTVDHLGRHILHPKDLTQEVRLHMSLDNPRYLSDDAGFGTYERTSEGLMLMECRGNRPAFSVLAGTRTIGPRAFAFQRHTHTVHVPEGVTELREAAFRGCTGLRTLELPSTLEVMGPNALFDCGLRHLRLPANLRDIDDSALLVNGSPHLQSHRHAIELEIDPANSRYFLESGILCEQLDDGTDRAIIYTETAACVHIPPSVKRLGRYLFYGAAGIEELTLHDGILPFDPQAFGVMYPIRRVHMMLTEPLDGRSAFDLHFVRSGSFSLTFIQVFHGGIFDVKLMIDASDGAICCMPNGYERAKLMLARLHDPYALTQRHEKQMQTSVRTRLMSICTAFGEHGYHEGFELLFELGFLDERNIDEALACVHATKSVASAAYLMELRRRFCGETVFGDYDL